MYMVKFGPTVLNFGYDFFFLVPFLGQPVDVFLKFRFSQRALDAHRDFYAVTISLFIYSSIAIKRNVLNVT